MPLSPNSIISYRPNRQEGMEGMEKVRHYRWRTRCLSVVRSLQLFCTPNVTCSSKSMGPPAVAFILSQNLKSKSSLIFPFSSPRIRPESGQQAIYDAFWVENSVLVIAILHTPLTRLSLTLFFTGCKLRLPGTGIEVPGHPRWLSSSTEITHEGWQEKKSCCNNEMKSTSHITELCLQLTASSGQKTEMSTDLRVAKLWDGDVYYHGWFTFLPFT